MGARDRDRSAEPPRHLRTRPRYHRIGAAGLSVLVTLTAVLAAAGVLPSPHGPSPAAAAPQTAGSGRDPSPSRVASATLPERAATPHVRADALPDGSGTGRRIVLDEAAQRVWLVGAHDRVRRTYPVSGSRTDNLHAGSYRVYSRSRHAVGVDDSGTMEFMVRFAHGAHAAIGFHAIPVKDGHRIQSVAELGTPRSHGCIRQRRADAKALWRFAPEGTRVVVLE